MAGIINRLTARGIASITAPGRHADGGNLYLSVSKSGARSWVFYYRRDGKQREMGLGPAGPGQVSLAEARASASEARRLLSRGQDPIEVKRETKAEAKAARAGQVSFGAFADDFVALHQPEWKNPKHRAQWRSTLGDAYCEELRRRPISEIGTEDVLKVIRPLWVDRRETASRLRQRIERVLDAAVVDGKRQPGLNPARWKGHLDLILPKRRRKGRHHPALPWAEMPAFMAALAQREGIAARALEFLIFTATRSGEVREARWGEIDIDKAIWTIPADRMKADRDQRIPLCDPAIAAIQTMLPLRPRTPADVPGSLVFPGLRKRPMSDATIAAVLKRMRVENATVHGMRSSFRDWATDLGGASFEVAEMALAHQVGDETVRAYLRTDLFDQRRTLMDRWAGFLLPTPEVGK